MIKLVTLDLDNTLWDADPIIFKAHRDMVSWLTERMPESAPHLQDDTWRSLRHRIVNERQDIAHHPTEIRKAMLRHALAPLPLSEQQRETLVEDAFAIFHEGRNQVLPFPEAIELLQYLQAHVPVIAITNGNSDLERIGIAQYFKAVVSAESAGVAKPHPDIFRQALQLVEGVTPQEALHVGDHTEEDIEASRALGFQTIWINLSRKEKPLHCHPDQVVHSSAELLAAIRERVPGKK